MGTLQGGLGRVQESPEGQRVTDGPASQGSTGISKATVGAPPELVGPR